MDRAGKVAARRCAVALVLAGLGGIAIGRAETGSGPGRHRVPDPAARRGRAIRVDAAARAGADRSASGTVAGRPASWRLSAIGRGSVRQLWIRIDRRGPAAPDRADRWRQLLALLVARWPRRRVCRERLLDEVRRRARGRSSDSSGCPRRRLPSRSLPDPGAATAAFSFRLAGRRGSIACRHRVAAR